MCKLSKKIEIEVDCTLFEIPSKKVKESGIQTETELKGNETQTDLK